MEDSNNRATFSVNVTTSAFTLSSRREIAVRFCYHDGNDEDRKTVILNGEETELELYADIVSKLERFSWPIDEQTVWYIANKVLQKVRDEACDIRVHIVRSSVDEEEETDEDDDVGCVVETSSLKRKRIDEEGSCVICLEELTTGTDVAVLPCDHCCFHEECISAWLENSASCPLCRRKMMRSDFES